MNSQSCFWNFLNANDILLNSVKQHMKALGQRSAQNCEAKVLGSIVQFWNPG